jgi:predicted transcriptional regulator
MAERTPEWISDTLGAVERASNAVQAQEELKIVSDASRELGQILAELEKLSAVAALGRSSWWSGVTLPSQVDELVDGVADKLERRDLAKLIPALKQFTTRTRNSLQSAWTSHVDERTGDTAELQELVDLLAGSGEFAIAGDLKRALDELGELRRRSPEASSIDQLTRTVALAERFEAMLPDVVKKFVSAAARGGASIGLLNAEVMKWLDDNGAVDSFKVVAGKPSGVRRG